MAAFCRQIRWRRRRANLFDDLGGRQPLQRQVPSLTRRLVGGRIDGWRVGRLGVHALCVCTGDRTENVQQHGRALRRERAVGGGADPDRAVRASHQDNRVT
jgi:hypothetical protein